MTSRVEFALALGLLAAPAFAESAPDTSVPESLVVQLEASDLHELAKGLEDVYGDRAVSGRFDERVQADYWWGSVGIQGVSYSFRLGGVQVWPEAGHVRATVELKDLAVNIDKLDLNGSDWAYCQNIPIWSGQGAIPVTTEATPTVDGRDFHLDAANTDVALRDDNFFVGRPEACHGIWGFNWLVRRIVPWAAGQVRDRLAGSIESALEKQAKELGASLNDVLQVSVTLPFGIEPAPRFYATMSLWPHAFEVTPEHFRFVIGADVTFDPDEPQPIQPNELESAWLERLVALSEQSPSYLGIARPLLAGILDEANTKGLFHLEVDARAMPAATDLLKASRLARVIPDAGSRFGAEAPLTLAFRGAERTGVALEPCGPGGIPIIELVLSGLEVIVKVDDEAYYVLSLDASLKFELGYKRDARQLAFTFVGFQAQVARGGFAQGIEPADPTFRGDRFALFLAELSASLSGTNGELLKVGLPDVAIGQRRMSFTGSSVRDDYITLDATVVTP